MTKSGSWFMVRGPWFLVRRSAFFVCGALVALLGLRTVNHARTMNHEPRTMNEVLRICADPNNLPFTNDRLEGFENRIAALMASDFGERVEYTWWAERRGFVRNTLKAHTCDLIVGVPAHFELALTSRPYYRSSYVFLWRRDRHLALRSLDDARLRGMRIGVQMIGDDFANTPPAHALSARGLINNIVGFSVYGDYRQPNPPSEIVNAVGRGEIDAALVWGPLAGYFATRQPVPLDLAVVEPQSDSPMLPFVFDISMAVRRGDAALQAKVNQFLTRRKNQVDAILRQFGVPRV
jgi:mxaJ protein